MAHPHPRPAHAGASSPASAFSPAIEAHAGLLADVLASAQQQRDALAALVQLLRASGPDHQITAGQLAALLDPISGGIQDVCDDLDTAQQGFSIPTFPVPLSVNH